MSELHIAFRSMPYGRYGISIQNGRGESLYTLNGCRSLLRAERVARGIAEEIIAADCAIGRRSWVSSGMPTDFGARVYAWQHPKSKLWHVADSDNAGTHRPGVSQECARYDVEQAIERVAS